MRRLLGSVTSDDGTDPYLPGHGDASYDVRHYDLDLVYKVDSNHLNGRARIDVTATAELEQVALDLSGLRVGKVQVSGGPRVAKYTTRRRKLIVTLASAVPAGARFTITVSYGGNPMPVTEDAGTAGWEELADGAIVAGQPGGAPSWFPCNDRPDNKATYRLAVTAPSGYHVVANGVLAGTSRRASATTWTYEQREPMATYLATVQIGRYTSAVSSSDPVTIRQVVPRGTRAHQVAGLRDQARMMSLFSEVFGPYPFEEYTVVVTADALEIPLEAQTLSVFGSNALSADWRDVRLVAHELAHQWFGNSLTLGRWQDIWLHEGFACYAEWLWSEADDVMSADRRAKEHWARLSRLGQDLVIADPGPDLMFDDRLYKRGALTLHFLRRTIGDDVFFALIREWVQTNAYGNVSTPDFEALAQRRSATDLGSFFNDWLHSKPLPALPE